jgi:hypothetical protein
MKILLELMVKIKIEIKFLKDINYVSCNDTL